MKIEIRHGHSVFDMLSCQSIHLTLLSEYIIGEHAYNVLCMKMLDSEKGKLLIILNKWKDCQS